MYLCNPEHCKYGPPLRSVDRSKGQKWPRTVICEVRSIAWHRRREEFSLVDVFQTVPVLVCTLWRLWHSTSGAGFASLTSRLGQWQQPSQLCRALFLACRAQVFRRPNRYGVHSFSYGQRRQSRQGRDHSETLARTWTERCRSTTAPWRGNTRERRRPRQQRFV